VGSMSVGVGNALERGRELSRKGDWKRRVGKEVGQIPTKKVKRENKAR